MISPYWLYVRGKRLLVLIVLIVCVQGHSAASPQDTDSKAAFERALGLLQAGKTEDALAAIGAAIGAGARDPSLYNLQGLAASALGRDKEAEESFRTVIRLSPNTAMGYNNLGILLEKLGRHQEAAAEFREGHAREPQNFAALLGLGTSLAALSKYEEAASYLEKAWNVRPGDFQVGYEWAHALLQAKQPLAAKKILSQLNPPAEPEPAAKYYSLAAVVAEETRDPAGGAQYYRQAYKLDPSYPIYLGIVRTTLAAVPPGTVEDIPPAPENLSASQNLALGLLFGSHEAYEKAIPFLEQASQLDPSNDIATLNLALAYKNAGKISLAVDLLKRALTARPSGVLYDALGDLQEDAGQYVDAVQSYQQAVELDSSSEQYYFDLGMEYLAHFTFGPAAEVFRVGAGKFPTSARQYLGLGFSHYAVREYKEAGDAFTKALEIEPDSPAAFQSWKTLLGSLAPNDWHDLLPRLERLSAAHPANPELSFCYGAARFRSEFAKGPEAAMDGPQAVLEKAVRVRPEFPEAHLELGALYAAKKMYQKAAEEYKEAARQDPKSDVAHYRLGQLYREMNQLDLAAAELDQYQKLNHLHQDDLKRSRAAIKQFILPQATKPAN